MSCHRVIDPLGLALEHFDVTGQYRNGDVRHAACTISRAMQELDWAPTVDAATGIRRLCEWIDSRNAGTEQL